MYTILELNNMLQYQQNNIITNEQEVHSHLIGCFVAILLVGFYFVNVIHHKHKTYKMLWLSDL